MFHNPSFSSRKSTSHMREMKHMKDQIDQIEMKVAAECKEAFAELQTSMNAMAADLPLGTPFIPFLSYKEYTARVRAIIINKPMLDFLAWLMLNEHIVRYARFAIVNISKLGWSILWMFIYLRVGRGNAEKRSFATNIYLRRKRNLQN